MYRGSRRQGPGLGMLLLGAQVMRFGIDRIPPVTLSCLAANVLIYLGLIDLPMFQQPLSSVCISSLHVWHAQDFSRLLLSSFFHSNDWHLYYNMASFLWKGTSLENRIGSIPFAFMIAIFSVLTNVVYVGLGVLGTEIFEDTTLLTQCAVGFSGVIFALKVVTTHYMSGNTYLLGFIPVPARYAVWAELVLIHFLVPHSSFMGHLAGIIVGTLYVYGPLHALMDIFIATAPRGSRRYYGNNSGYTYGSGVSGYGGNRPRQSYHDHEHYNEPQPEHPAAAAAAAASGADSAQYHSYTGGLTEDEQLQEAIRMSQGRPPQPGFGGGRAEPSAPPPEAEHHGTSGGGSRLYPDLSAAATGGSTTTHTTAAADVEEMRRRRLRRFDH